MNSKKFWRVAHVVIGFDFLTHQTIKECPIPARSLRRGGNSRVLIYDFAFEIHFCAVG